MSLLEAELLRVKTKLEAEKPQEQPIMQWWERRIGAFKDNPDYEEAMRLGREYREAQQNGHEDRVSRAGE